MSDKTLKFGDVEVNKKGFNTFKISITLNLLDIDKIVISDKFKHSDKGSKYFVGYKVDNVFRPLCIILPRMSGHIKYFDNDGKNISFKIKNDSVLVK